jgi:hypothetical protein
MFKTVRTAATLSESLLAGMPRLWLAKPTKVKQLFLRLSLVGARALLVQINFPPFTA